MVKASAQVLWAVSAMRDGPTAARSFSKSSSQPHVLGGIIHEPIPAVVASLAARCCRPLTFEIQSGLFSTAQHDTIHTIFAPLHYEPGYSYPLVVWLHGSGCDERQLLRIMPLVSMRNYVAVAPRGVASLRGAGQSRGWRPTARTAYGWSQDEQDLQQAEQRIFDSIEMTFRRFNIDPRRIFLAGFDTGGTMAFRVAMNHPYKFAGVLSLGGCLPTGGAPFPACPRPGSWRSSWPRAGGAPSMATSKSATTCGSCTRRACRSPCGYIRAAMSFRRRCCPTSIAGSWSRSRRARLRASKIRNHKHEIRNKFQ